MRTKANHLPRCSHGVPCIPRSSILDQRDRADQGPLSTHPLSQRSSRVSSQPHLPTKKGTGCFDSSERDKEESGSFMGFYYFLAFMNRKSCDNLPPLLWDPLEYEMRSVCLDKELFKIPSKYSQIGVSHVHPIP